MNTEPFEINGTCYVIDMERVMEYVSKTGNNEKLVETSITQVFAEPEETASSKNAAVGGMKPISKEIAENKSSVCEIFHSYRYDFVKTLLNTILSPYYNSDGSFMEFEDEDDMHLGMKFAFNTLLANGIIVEVKQDDGRE